jgi:hypothetical protein
VRVDVELDLDTVRVVVVLLIDENMQAGDKV